jgi:hypothetical protein
VFKASQSCQLQFVHGIKQQLFEPKNKLPYNFIASEGAPPITIVNIFKSSHFEAFRVLDSSFNLGQFSYVEVTLDGITTWANVERPTLSCKSFSLAPAVSVLLG